MTITKQSGALSASLCLVAFITLVVIWKGAQNVGRDSFPAGV